MSMKMEFTPNGMIKSHANSPSVDGLSLKIKNLYR